jgi:hypothetical protein
MGISDKVWDALTGAIKLTDRPEGLGRQVSPLATEVNQGAADLREMDKRLVRLETMLEVALAAKGAVISAQAVLPRKPSRR